MNENVIRSLSGLVYIFLIVAGSLYSKESLLFLFGLILLQIVREFCNLVSLPVIPSLIISGILYFIFGFFLSFNQFTDLGLIIACLFVLVKLIFWIFNKSEVSTLETQNKWVNLIGYIVLPIICLVKIATFDGFEPMQIICIFILIWTNDTFAYIVGKTMGKRKLFETISPKKTVEGFIGGMLFSILAGFIIAHYYFLKPPVFWIATALITSVFGTLGDLVESKFKRQANVKDSGNIMPGHGGLLDRLDSVIFVAPFLFLLFKILNYVS